jgi:hypothetical protein
MYALPAADQGAAYQLVFLPTVAPLALLVLACLSWSVTSWLAVAAVLAIHWLTFAWLNGAYLFQATPWRWAWLVPVVQCVLPLHLLAATVRHGRIHWRGHVLQTRPGGGLEWQRRRDDVLRGPVGDEACDRCSFAFKAALVFPIAVVHSLIYRTLTNTHFFPVRVMQPTRLDEAIPFLPWTIWPYLAMIACSIGYPLLVRSRRVFHLTLLAYLIATVTAFGIYVVYPTAIARPGVSLEPGAWSVEAYRRLVATLGEYSCLPSGHIIFPLLGSWALVYDRRTWWTIGLAALTLAMSFSILTLKEHVAWDWLGGFLVGAVAIALAARLMGRGRREFEGGVATGDHRSSLDGTPL